MSLEFKQVNINNPIITFKLEFEGYYGDMDYDYNKEFFIPDNEQNRLILEKILKTLPDKPYGCSASQDFTSKINELLEEVKDEDCYIGMQDDWYPYWELTVYYYDNNGKQFEVSYKE